MHGARGSLGTGIARAIVISALVMGLGACNSGQPVDLPAPLDLRPVSAEGSIDPEALDALAAPEDVALFALESVGKGPPLPEGDSVFNGYRVINEVKSNGHAGRLAAISLRTAIMDGSKNPLASCFMPRHGLRTRNAGEVFDFVICYECSKVAVFRNGKHVSSISIQGSPDVLDGLLRPTLPDS